MAGIQLRLQKELFAPNDEQLMAMAHCFKATSAATTGQGGTSGGQKRKEIYLCVLNDTTSSHHGNKGGLNISITEVKASDPQSSGQQISSRFCVYL